MFMSYCCPVLSKACYIWATDTKPNLEKLNSHLKKWKLLKIINKFKQLKQLNQLLKNFSLNKLNN